MNLLVTTNNGYSIVYHDIIKKQLSDPAILPLIKGKQDLIPACEIIDFDLELEKENYNIILGLYSQYLLRYG